MKTLGKNDKLVVYKGGVRNLQRGENIYDDGWSLLLENILILKSVNRQSIS